MWQFIANRLLEASTTRGLIAVIGGLAGFEISNTQTEAVVSLVIAFSGLLKVFLPDKFGKAANA